MGSNEYEVQNLTSLEMGKLKIRWEVTDHYLYPLEGLVREDRICN
jgi:hypothetical protein